MRTRLGARRYNHLTRAAGLLVIAALTAGTVAYGGQPASSTSNLSITSTSGGSATTPSEGAFPCPPSTAMGPIAEPEAVYCSMNWTGNVGTVADVRASTTTFTMNGNYAIAANFERYTPAWRGGGNGPPPKQVLS